MLVVSLEGRARSSRPRRLLLLQVPPPPPRTAVTVPRSSPPLHHRPLPLRVEPPNSRLPRHRLRPVPRPPPRLPRRKRRGTLSTPMGTARSSVRLLVSSASRTENLASPRVSPVDQVTDYDTDVGYGKSPPPLFASVPPSLCERGTHTDQIHRLMW